MLSTSPQMSELFELIKRVARTDSSVLIRGETGTGKELVARAIHDLSARAGGPFRAVNCATFTPELLASELFGHVRGAFTGAIRDRAGLFELADGGTVFLDEIAEMPLDLQARLLRVVQERTFVPVGGTDPITVNVRLLSATNKALRHEVAEHRFREDLMYRIRVVPLFLPRLIEREGDVEALLWHFIDEHNKQSTNRVIESVDREVIEAMCEYDWPGNVRELANVVEYAYAVGEGPVLTMADLTPELRGEPPPFRGEAGHDGDSDRARIHDALAQTGGHKTRAAEILGISRSTLWRKLRELKLG
jgi:two-component system response regulator AtoC